MKLYLSATAVLSGTKKVVFKVLVETLPFFLNPLTPLKRLGQYLKEIPFDQIYSSDLPRAVRSAEIIQSQLKTPCPLESVPNLREWQLGKLEGLKICNLGSYLPTTNQSFSI